MAHFRKYKPEDFIRIRDFLVSTYKNTGIPFNWLIDRWNFVRYFAQVIHGTYETWPDTIGLWEDVQGDITAVVCSEGEERGETFFQMVTPDLPECLLLEMFDYAEQNLMKQEDNTKKIQLRIPENAPQIAAMAEARGYRPAGWQETWTTQDLKPSSRTLVTLVLS